MAVYRRELIPMGDVLVRKWYKDDELHRTDGPAIERLYKLPLIGDNEWWVNGIRYYDMRAFIAAAHLTDEEAVLLKLRWGGC